MKPRPITLIILLSLFIALPLNTLKAVAQQPNPPYLSHFPSVDRVLNAMKTVDPRETAIRQMGAFYQLVEIIKTLSGSREFRGFTPDEQRVIGMYQTASYNLGEAASKLFPGVPANGLTDTGQNKPDIVTGETRRLTVWTRDCTSERPSYCRHY